MNRAARVALSEQTLQIIETGGYECGGPVSLRTEIDAAVAGTRLYRDADFPQDRPLSGSFDTRFEVTDETTLAAAARLHAEAPDEDQLLLNFASAKNPGGGFLSGSQAQEESLARSSALYACLMAQFAMYEHNRARPTGLYSDWMIRSPRVPVFRDDAGALLARPYLASFVTAPAVNAGAVRQNEPDREGEIEPTNRERARKLLWLANAQGHRTLVLGAWGCGVFRNDPRGIAGMFADLLHGEFAGRFACVVMAVYDTTADRHVHAAFVERFG